MTRSEKKKATHITLRIPSKVMEHYVDLIEKSGLSHGQFFKEVISAYDGDVVIQRDSNEKKAYYKQLLFYSCKASNNINQIAYQLNRASLSNEVSESLIRESYESLLYIEDMLRQALSRAKL